MASQLVWQERAQKERERRDASIAHLAPGNLTAISVPKTLNVLSIPHQHLSDAENAHTESATKYLVQRLAAGELTSVEVLQAFLQRARIAQKLVNCITELLTERALARAKYLDEYYKQHGKPIGPLHGLPMSVKEHVGLKGYDVNEGFVGKIGNKSPIDASVVAALEQAGAVFFARTTEPQGLLMVETETNIYGLTTNPHNTDLTCGGSSGGEAALIALRGSPLGIGGDIGGSIRAPSANCGIYGLRPTTGRLPLVGLAAPNIGCETIMPTLGPLSSSIFGIKLFMKAILDGKPWESDPGVHQIPWRNEEGWIDRLATDEGRKLRIGVMWDDGVVKPLPPVARALHELVDKLKALPEVEVVDWQPQDHNMALDILAKQYSPDGGEIYEQCAALSGEPLLPLVAWTARDSPRVKPLSMQDVWALTMEREMYRYGHFQAWKASGIDLLLCPAGPSPAPQHGTSRYWGYLSIWNLLDYPAIVFPVNKVDPARDARDAAYTPRNDDDRWAWDHYDVHKEEGAPVGLQLVGCRLEDEKVVEGLEWIKEKVGLPFVDVFA